MGDARLDQVLIDGQLGRGDDVVGGGKDGVHPLGNEGGDGGNQDRFEPAAEMRTVIGKDVRTGVGLLAALFPAGGPVAYPFGSV